MSKRKNTNTTNRSPSIKKQKHVKYPNDFIPQFLDAQSSITAARFGARRLPEMRTLWISFLQSRADAANAMNDGAHIGGVGHEDELYYKSGGCKVSNRHLRRRTGSHNRRKRHRYPTAGLESSGSGNEIKEESLVQVSSKNNVIESVSKPKSRKARRKPQLLRLENSKWWTREEHDSIHGIVDGGKNWLATHLWHAKRFYMTQSLSIYNNWCIPLGHTNRGSRAAIRLGQSKSTIQDATWSISGKCIILESKHQEDLINVVEIICGGSKIHSAPFLTIDRVLKGYEVGYGYCYDVDCTFPTGLLGPAFFMFGERKINGGSSNDRIHYFVRICVEGSIMNKVENMLGQVIMDVTKTTTSIHEANESSDIQVCREAMSLIRVRGFEATNAIANSLQVQTNENNGDGSDSVWDWSIDPPPNDCHELLSHGTVITLKCIGVKECKEDKTEKDMELEEHVNDKTVEEIMKTVHFGMMDHMLQENEIVLISQMPSPVETSERCHENNHNAIVSGWDILCRPSQTSMIFLALNNIGGACAIGFIEDAAMRMESEPPLPVWPRDFPDTAVGQQYWSGEDREWKVLRYCIEQGLGGGRIKTGLRRLLKGCNNISDKVCHDKDNNNIHASCISRKLIQKKIEWDRVVSGAKDDNSMVGDMVHPVVVRGNLNAPFLHALHGFGKNYFDAVDAVSSNEDNDKKMRRPRRKVRGNDISITLPPLNNMVLQDHQNFCATLLKSLAIPALLNCQLITEGKGNISPGMIICAESSMHEDADAHQTKLGFVVSGGFCQRRGRAHGLGFISSKQFLSVLSESMWTGKFLVVARQNQRTIALKVILRSEAEKYKTKSDIVASLTILS